MIAFETFRKQFCETALVLIVIAIPAATQSEAKHRQVALKGHVLQAALEEAEDLGSFNSQQTLRITIPLKYRDEKGLTELIRQQSEPSNALYGKFLTADEFTARFAPTSSDSDRVKNYLRSAGLSLESHHDSSPASLPDSSPDSSTLIQATGTVEQIESAFNVSLHQFRLANGRIAHAATTEPTVDENVARLIHGVAGLNNIDSLPVSNGSSIKTDLQRGIHSRAAQAAPTNYTPDQIRHAYGLDLIGNSGSGQSVAFVEFDGYNASDVTAFATAYHIANPPPLQNILVDGATGAAGSNALEVTIDIEMLMTAAPGLKSILVYEGPSQFPNEASAEQGWLDIFDRIASDNLASVVSCSWANPESRLTGASIQAQNALLMRMAAQGQTFFTSTGDNGSYDLNGVAQKINNPADQPYVTSVGGTALKIDVNGTYLSETSWGLTGFTPNRGGGGGVSSVWPLPSWQAGFATSANKGSATMRMIPDVALDASNETCYAGIFNGAADCFWGTSFATPIWAGFAALVNSKRTALSLPRLGFLNPALYQLGQSSLYSSSFHDVQDASTNLYYPAVSGYDLSTGWGTLNGSGLFNALANSILPPLAPSNLQVTAEAQ